MNLPGDKKQDELRLRAAAERQIDNAPRDEPLARPAEELLHELISDDHYQPPLREQIRDLPLAFIAC